MSIALALHAGAYVMMATDTRRTAYNADGTVREHSDNGRKTHLSEHTVIVGTGLVPLLDRVSERICALKTTAGDDAILRIIAEERQAVALHPHWAEIHKRQGIEKTSWMLSRRSPGGLQLLSYYGSLGHRVGVLERGACVPIIPVDQTDDTEEVWRTFRHLLGYCRTCDVGDDVDETITYNAAVMRALVDACARQFETVSAEARIAVHPVDGAPRWLASERPDPPRDADAS